MRRSLKITWESFSKDGKRYVREEFGEYSAVLGPIHEFESITGFIAWRKGRIGGAIWLELQRVKELNESEKRRLDAYEEYRKKALAV